MDFTAFNWIDLAIIVVVAVSIVISLIRGFVREAISLATWILAIWIGLNYYGTVAEYLTRYIQHENVRTGVAFFILFVATLIIGAVINFVISQLVRKTGLSGTDRLIGMVFGFARGALVVSLLILVAGLSSLPQQPWWHASVLIPQFKPVAMWLEEFLPQTLTFNLG